MNVGVVFEPVCDPGFPAGYYYAHLPSLGLTTHGLGVEGAREAALELGRLWIEEKRANGEPVPSATGTLFATLEFPDHALQGA
jgi:predicted RNase H-like HicB family nuclease